MGLKYSFCNCLMPLLGVYIASCTTDAGYDPREEFQGKSIDYVVEGFYEYENDYFLPHCDSTLQGKMFYVEENSMVYGCIDGYWTEMRSLDSRDSELSEVVYYDPKATPTLSIDESKYKLSEITDPRDGSSYKTVIIDGLEWFAQNLDYDVGNNTVESSCVKLMEATHCRRYTRYYNIGSSGNTLDDVCPLDFKIPTKEEWYSLLDAVGGDRIAGKKLKSTNFKVDKQARGEDAISFSIMPAGYRTNSSYATPGETAGFWTSDDYGIFFSGYWDYVSNYRVSSGDYLSVRCVRSAR